MPSVRPRYLIASLAGLLLVAYGVHARLFAAPPDAGLLTAEVRKADIEQTVIATGSLEAYKQVSVGALPWVAPVLFVLYITRFQVRPEERVLAELFGPPYTDYTQRVRRWI